MMPRSEMLGGEGRISEKRRTPGPDGGRRSGRERAVRMMPRSEMLGGGKVRMPEIRRVPGPDAGA